MTTEKHYESGDNTGRKLNLVVVSLDTMRVDYEHLVVVSLDTMRVDYEHLR